MTKFELVFFVIVVLFTVLLLIIRPIMKEATNKLKEKRRLRLKRDLKWFVEEDEM